MIYRALYIIFSFPGYCLSGDTLSDICGRIRVEAILYTLVRGKRQRINRPIQYIEYIGLVYVGPVSHYPGIVSGRIIIAVREGHPICNTCIIIESCHTQQDITGAHGFQMT